MVSDGLSWGILNKVEGPTINGGFHGNVNYTLGYFIAMFDSPRVSEKSCLSLSM